MTDLSKLTREELLALRAKVLSELSDVLAEMTGGNTTGSTVGPSIVPVEEAIDPAEAALKDILARWPLGLASIEYLRSCKKPQTARQIAEAMLKAGREFESDQPARAVKDALKKALAKNKDLFHVRWAEWYLKSRCTRARFAKLTARNTAFGTAGRNAAEHGNRTRKGMMKARDEGKQIGAPRKFTPETLAEAKQLLSGGMSVADVAAKFEVSKPLIYSIFHIRHSKGTVTVSYKDPTLNAVPPPDESDETKPFLKVVK